MSVAAMAAAGAVISATVGLGSLVSNVRSRDRRQRDARELSLMLRAAASLGRAVGSSAAPSRVDRQIAAAGLPRTVTAGDVTAMTVGAAVCGVTSGVLLGSGGGPRGTLLSAATLGAIGAASPELWLRNRVRQRRTTAALELPIALDLLRVAIAAGMPVRRAVAEVGARTTGLVATELAVTTARLELGEAVDNAYLGLRRRLPSRHVAVLVEALLRAERHGAPLGPSLTALAAEVRSARAIELQERGARIVPRMQLVIALLLVPSVLALVAAVALGRFA